jgi:hypothetical protein
LSRTAQTAELLIWGKCERLMRAAEMSRNNGNLTA